MKLEQSFSVAAPVEQVWAALIDVERIAPCLPGAEITGVDESGAYKGTFSIKLGPTTAAYRGSLRMEAVDEAARTVTMSAKGTDMRGQGGASATIVSTMREEVGETHVDVLTDFHITGRLARFGRSGMIEDISKGLMRDFADCLQAMIGAEPAAAVPGPTSPAPVPPDDAGADASASGGWLGAPVDATGAPVGGAGEPAPPPPGPDDANAADAAVASAGGAAAEAATAGSAPPGADDLAAGPAAPAPAPPDAGTMPPPPTPVEPPDSPSPSSLPSRPSRSPERPGPGRSRASARPATRTCRRPPGPRRRRPRRPPAALRTPARRPCRSRRRRSPPSAPARSRRRRAPTAPRRRPGNPAKPGFSLFFSALRERIKRVFSRDKSD